MSAQVFESDTPVVDEYAFDCHLFATLRIKARSRKEAEATIRDVIDGASCNAGCWPDGSPILFESGIDSLDLLEVNGEAAF